MLLEKTHSCRCCLATELLTYRSYREDTWPVLIEFGSHNWITGVFLKYEEQLSCRSLVTSETSTVKESGFLWTFFFFLPPSHCVAFLFPSCNKCVKMLLLPPTLPFHWLTVTSLLKVSSQIGNYRVNCAPWRPQRELVDYNPPNT